jgi:small GTP-binding protein
MEEEKPALNSNLSGLDGIGFSVSHSKDESVLTLSAEVGNLIHLQKAVKASVEKIPGLKETGSELILELTADKKDPEGEHLFKIVLLGETNSGKTCLCSRYSSGVYSHHFGKSIGVDIKVKSLYLEDGSHCRLQIWDTAGADRFANQSRAYMRGSQGIIITADLLATSDRMIAEVEAIFQRVLCYTDFPKTRVILAGMKAEYKFLAQENAEKLESLADELGIPFIKCSALSGLNVSTLFETLARMIILEKQPRHVFSLSFKNANSENFSLPNFYEQLEGVISASLSGNQFTGTGGFELNLYRKAVNFLLKKEGKNGPLLIEFQVKQARSINSSIQKEALDAVQKYKVVESRSLRPEKNYFSKNFL